MNELNVKVVDIGHGLDGNGAGVALSEVLACLLFLFLFLLHMQDMIHSAAQKRWGEVASCTYRVGVKLAEAHRAGFNEYVGRFSVPSSAGYNIREREEVLWWECVEEKTAGGGKRGIINFSSSAVEMADEFCCPC